MSFGGNKLPPHQENPLDVVCLKIASDVSPWFRSMGATPNFITTLSVIASVLAIWSLYRGDAKGQFIVWAMLSYFFDCLDGHFARRYDMCTKFGDYYDHISDWIYFIGIFYTAFVIRGFKSSWKPYKMWIYGLLIVVGLVTMIHMGLQEVLYQNEDDNESPTLSIFTGIANKLCVLPDECIKATRWIGVGTFIAVMIAVIAITVR